MENNTQLTVWKPYTVIVDKDDNVHVVYKTRDEVNDAMMSLGYVMIAKSRTTLNKYEIKRFFEVGPENATTVENRIYSQPTQYIKELLAEHKRRKDINMIGIKTIQQGESILAGMLGIKKTTGPDIPPPMTPEQREQAKHLLLQARSSVNKSK